MIDKQKAREKGLKIIETRDLPTIEWQAKIDKLKALIPDIVNSDNQLDINALADFVERSGIAANDRGYELTFAGKGLAKAQAEIPTEKDLRVEYEQSKNFDDTENVLIRGDNLDVLKILRQNYTNKIKMIYIDPPYNTKSDSFLYKDNFKVSYEKLMEEFDLDPDTINYLSNVYGTRSHSFWLSFMYPRLKLARELLREDGVIFISIDDNEQANLKILCDEIFGEDNFVDMLKWKRKKQPSFLAKHTASIMEYILVYAKSFDKLEKLSIEGTSDFTKKVINVSNGYSSRILKSGTRIKKEGSGVLKAGKYTIKTMDVEYKTDVKYDNGQILNDVEVIAKFSVTQDSINDFMKNNLLFITTNSGLRRDVSETELGKRKSITDLLLEWGDNQDSEREITEFFDNPDIFEFTKPTKLIKNIIKSIIHNENDIILDFFAGSGTTGDAVM
ncbi:MAG: hypothetical protein ATN35_02875 [Epulopiscium sp. Nele67-Bin004]|nr:MAG: hypothetical protein ATN35_02875 [Epulopiscium sp. Nele67-Bin004]